MIIFASFQPVLGDESSDLESESYNGASFGENGSGGETYDETGSGDGTSFDETVSGYETSNLQPELDGDPFINLPESGGDPFINLPESGGEPTIHLPESGGEPSIHLPEPGADTLIPPPEPDDGQTFVETQFGIEPPFVQPVPSPEQPLVQPAPSLEKPLIGPVPGILPPYLPTTSGEEPLKKKCEAKCAVAVVKSPTGEVGGILYFYQNTTCSKIHLHGHLCFLHIRSKSVGFHIHEYGDVSDGCNRIGPHYNPYHLNHGPLYARNRHVGDLGNVNVSCYGQSEICLDLPRSITLWGRKSIVGRSIAIDSNQDDLGLGGNEQSLITGNSPPTIGCGVIGVSKCDCYDEEEPTCPG